MSAVVHYNTEEEEEEEEDNNNNNSVHPNQTTTRSHPLMGHGITKQHPRSKAQGSGRKRIKTYKIFKSFEDLNNEFKISITRGI